MIRFPNWAGWAIFFAGLVSFVVALATAWWGLNIWAYPGWPLTRLVFIGSLLLLTACFVLGAVSKEDDR